MPAPTLAPSDVLRVVDYFDATSPDRWLWCVSCGYAVEEIRGVQAQTTGRRPQGVDAVNYTVRCHGQIERKSIAFRDLDFEDLARSPRAIGWPGGEAFGESTIMRARRLLAESNGPLDAAGLARALGPVGDPRPMRPAQPGRGRRGRESMTAAQWGRHRNYNGVCTMCRAEDWMWCDEAVHRRNGAPQAGAEPPPVIVTLAGRPIYGVDATLFVKRLGGAREGREYVREVLGEFVDPGRGPLAPRRAESAHQRQNREARERQAAAKAERIARKLQRERQAHQEATHRQAARVFYRALRAVLYAWCTAPALLEVDVPSYAPAPELPAEQDGTALRFGLLEMD